MRKLKRLPPGTPCASSRSPGGALIARDGRKLGQVQFLPEFPVFSGKRGMTYNLLIEYMFSGCPGVEHGCLVRPTAQEKLNLLPLIAQGRQPPLSAAERNSAGSRSALWSYRSPPGYLRCRQIRVPTVAVHPRNGTPPKASLRPSTARALRGAPRRAHRSCHIACSLTPNPASYETRLTPGGGQVSLPGGSILGLTIGRDGA